MNLAGALGAMGVDAANAYAGRDKAPFRMCVGLPPLGGGAGGKRLGCVESRTWDDGVGNRAGGGEGERSRSR